MIGISLCRHYQHTAESAVRIWSDRARPGRDRKNFAKQLLSLLITTLNNYIGAPALADNI
jgi:hypothetical protein